MHLEDLNLHNSILLNTKINKDYIIDNDASETKKGTYFVSSLAMTSSLTEYGISSIFTLFLIHVLHFSIPLSSSMYSQYYGFAYILPIFVGLISDRYMAKTRSLLIGFISMIISQLILFASASLYAPSSVEQTAITFNLQNILFIVGLAFLALGTSFANNTFSNIISLVSNNTQEAELDSYSIYYSLLNLGVIIGILIMTFVVGDTNYMLFKWSFLIFAIFLAIGMIVFLYARHVFLVNYQGELVEDKTDENNEGILRKIASGVKSILHGILHIKSVISNFISSLSQTDKDRLILFFLILIFIIIYRIGYNQSSASMIIFEESYVVRDYGFLVLPIQLFSIFNPLFIILLSPLYSKFNKKAAEKNWNFGLVTRVGIGLLLLSICFIVLADISYLIDVGVTNKISILWIIIYELILALSELFLSVTGYAMVAELAPANNFALFFGIFQSTHAIARYLTGWIINIFPASETATLFLGSFPINGLTNFFLLFAVPALICGIILIYKRKSLERRVHYGE